MRFLSQTSLTQRLTLMFVAATTAVLLVLGQVIAASVEQHFEELDMEVLSGKMELIAQALQSHASADDLTQLSHQLARSLVGHHGLEVMLLEPDKSVIFATAGANFPAPDIAAQARNSPGRPVLRLLGGQTYRVLAAHLPTAAHDAQGQAVSLVVAAAIDIGHHQAYMRSFVHTLWWFVAAAAALLGLLGWFVVRRGLAPLRTLGEQARVVTAQQLSHRLPMARMPVELAQLAESLNDMLARLEVAFARLSDFSSDIAHELRTPVSNLMTQTQVALSRPRSADNNQSVLESNAEELERMARMISDMLLLAKAEHGLVVPQLETIDLDNEVRALFAYFDVLAEEKGLSLTLTGAADVPADRLMLRRALANLLSNAIRHATPGSAVQVDIRTRDGAVELVVSNHGETIAPEFLGRVFDRFFRVDPARQRSPDGSGLGLAITRSIVTAHGGQISAASGDGLTRFTITLAQAATPQP